MNHKWIIKVEIVLTCERGVYSHACAESHIASRNHSIVVSNLRLIPLTENYLKLCREQFIFLLYTISDVIIKKKSIIDYKKNSFHPLPLNISIFFVNSQGNVINLSSIIDVVGFRKNAQCTYNFVKLYKSSA